MISAGDPHGTRTSGPSGVRTLLPILLLATLALACALGVAGAVVDQDLRVDTHVDWTDAGYTVSANVTVASGGTLNVTGAVLTFSSPPGAPVGLFVEPGGSLVMTDVTCQAEGGTYTIASAGHVSIVRGTLSGLYSRESNGSLEDTAGGILVDGGTIDLVDVSIASEQIGLTLLEAEVEAEGLTISADQYGIFANASSGSLAGLTVEGAHAGLVLLLSSVDLTTYSFSNGMYALYASESDLTLSGMTSRAFSDHMVLDNCTTNITDSDFEGGEVGVLAITGYLEVVGCEFRALATGVEMYYGDGRLSDVLVEEPYDVGIQVESLAYWEDEPVIELGNITVRRGTEAAISVVETRGLTISNLTIEGCGDGLSVVSSIVKVVGALITGSTQCRPTGCSYTATGTGVFAETSIVDLANVTIEGSNGPAVTATFSSVNATGSRFVDGNASGMLLVYTDVHLYGCEVSGNAFWGLESLGFDLEMDDLDATWGNERADIRMNMTLNVKVLDDGGDWLSHADVTATSGDISVGPYTTGFGGSTPTFELPIYEWTDGSGETSFNPWSFLVVYGEFESTTQVDLQIGLPEVSLVVEVRRADLSVSKIDAPSRAELDGEVTVRVTVVNGGDHPVTSTVLTLYYRDEHGFQRVIGERAVGPIAPGGSVDTNITWKPGFRGDFLLVAFVDVDDLVDEEDEDNNRVERAIEVEEGGGDDVPGPGVIAALAVLAMVTVAMSAVRRDHGRV